MKGRWIHLGLVLLALAVFAAGAFSAYRRWEARAAEQQDEHAGEEKLDEHVEGVEEHVVELSPQAQKNLGLVVKPLAATTYWRRIELPGILIDRAGMSDVGVAAPVTGIVTRIDSHPGESLTPGAPLFTLRLTSESLYASQRELFKATREIEIARQQRQRLESLAQEGALAQSRIIEIDNSIQRLEVSEQAYRQDLVARGLSSEQVRAAASGAFVTEITVRAPQARAQHAESHAAQTSMKHPVTKQEPFRYEFEELHVALGEQAEAGQLLGRLADHRSLLVEGHGFKDDLPLIQRAAKQGLPIQIELEQQEGLNWPEAPRELFIHHVDNSIDTETRTFSFHLLLENQWQTYRQGDHVGVLWRFQPGDRVRLSIAVEKFDNVLVLPREAVVREGPEAYVFQQREDHFERTPVHVLTEDRSSVVIAQEGSLEEGAPVAQNAAAALLRVLKVQMGGSAPEEHHHDH
jgi:multidrug efflux pump subunit AcrA (membrane-fusion protein)